MADGRHRQDAQLYHRIGDPADVIAKIGSSGELWGRVPRGFFQSDIPKVKAYDGALPGEEQGFEFTSTVAPDPGGVPGKPTWSGPRPGVRVEGEFAKIACIVTKVRK